MNIDHLISHILHSAGFCVHLWWIILYIFTVHLISRGRGAASRLVDAMHAEQRAGKFDSHRLCSS